MDPLNDSVFRERLTLHIGTAGFDGHDATATDSGTILTWSNSGLTWADMQTYAVRLTMSVPGVDSIAFGGAGTDGAFKTGAAVTASVTFSEAVSVTGTPQLEIDVGGTEKTLDYSSGSGGATLVFAGYTVAAGDVDADGLSVAANKLTLNSGTIQASGGGNPDADLDHDAVPASASHKVDGVKPTLVTTGAGAPRASSDGTKIILTFSENIGSVDRTKITVKSGTNTLTTTADSKSGATVDITLTTALTSADTSVTVELAADAVTDVAGNGIAAAAIAHAVDAAASADEYDDVTIAGVAVTVLDDDATATAPGRPTDLTAGTVTATSVVMSWSAPTDDGGTDVTDYTVEWPADGNDPWTVVTAGTPSPETTFTPEELTPSTTYHYRVRAVNAAGQGAASDPASATTLVGVTIEAEAGPVVARAWDRADFTLTRTGDASAVLAVTVEVTETGDYTAEGTRIVIFAAGDSTAALSLPLDESGSRDGTIAAEVAPGTFAVYGPGTPGSATLAVQVFAPAMEIGMTGETASVTEGGQVSVAVVASSAAGAARPSGDVSITVTVASHAETATSGADFDAVSEGITFDPSELSLYGQRWVATRQVTVTATADTGYEGDETFGIVLQRTAGRSGAILIVDATPRQQDRPWEAAGSDRDSRHHRGQRAAAGHFLGATHVRAGGRRHLRHRRHDHGYGDVQCSGGCRDHRRHAVARARHRHCDAAGELRCRHGRDRGDVHVHRGGERLGCRRHPDRRERVLAQRRRGHGRRQRQPRRRPDPRRGGRRCRPQGGRGAPAAVDDR